jgi:hypothetical protein
MNSPAPLATPLLPAATLVAAAFFLFGALSSASVHAPTPVRTALLDPAPVEIAACERARVRSHSDCVSEAEGKALIRHAEWVAALEETGQDAVDGTALPASVIVVRPQRAVSE